MALSFFWSHRIWVKAMREASSMTDMDELRAQRRDCIALVFAIAGDAMANAS